jgi:glycosyltransferase involved in cell wall biosynthesis
MKRMRVAIIAPSTVLPVPSIYGGAIETLITGFIDINEERKSLEIIVFSPFNKNAKRQSKNYSYTRFQWIRYSWINKVVNIVTRVFSKISNKPIPHFGILQITYFLRKLNPVLVIVEGDDQIIIPVSRTVGCKKTIFHLHARLFSTPEVYAYCNTVIAVSHYIKHQVLQNTDKTAETVLVLKNCIDIPKFSKRNNSASRGKIRSEYNIPDKDIVICFMGRIVKEKGLMELIKALSLLPKNLNFRLLIMGSPGSGFGLSKGKTAYYSEVEALSGKLGNKVIFTGFIRNDKIPQYLSASDIAAVPSMYEEPQGLTVLESFAAGLPVVTTDSGGIPENVTEDSAIVIKRDKEIIPNLSRAILELILSEEKRKAMGKAGFAHVQKYGLNDYYSDFIRILLEIEKNLV